MSMKDRIVRYFSEDEIKKMEREARHEAVVDKGIEISTAGVIASGATTAICETAHVITQDVLWGHLVGTAAGLFFGSVALNASFVGYRLYKLVSEQNSMVNELAAVRLEKKELEALLREIRKNKWDGMDDPNEAPGNA